MLNIAQGHVYFIQHTQAQAWDSGHFSGTRKDWAGDHGRPRVPSGSSWWPSQSGHFIAVLHNSYVNTQCLARITVITEGLLTKKAVNGITGGGEPGREGK